MCNAAGFGPSLPLGRCSEMSGSGVKRKHSTVGRNGSRAGFTSFASNPQAPTKAAEFKRHGN